MVRGNFLKKIIFFIGLATELAILIGLLWKHTDLYDFSYPFLLLLLLPVLIPFHWHLLRKYKKNRFSRPVQLKLFFLTGPSIILCLSLVVSINTDLERIRLVGGSTKEMGMALTKMAKNKDVSYPDSIPQWVDYNVKKMKSDRIIYAMLFASMFLLYVSRCSKNSGENEILQHIDEKSTSD